jgi:pimeloyl-ACP methyl ester carboxylesterase
MRLPIIFVTAISAVQSTYGAALVTVPRAYTVGFKNPNIVSSASGAAICIQGTIPVTASATNTKLSYEPPENQTVVTETIFQMLKLNSTLINSVEAGPLKVTGTYDIYSKLCYPKSGTINAKTVQILIHGVGFDRSYWDVAPGYSYVDAAAEAGYTTFSYDRLGSGLSSHPDPIQIVQAQIEVGIAHALVQLLRAGHIAATSFAHVASVGHSFGSIQTVGLTSQYPEDLDAAVLTGFSTGSAGGLSLFVAGLNLAIASLNSPLRFADLPNAYLIASSAISNQFDFLRAQNFPAANLDIAEMTKQTFSIGEVFTIGDPSIPSPKFTGPVDVVDGSDDVPFCQGNCLYPVNMAAAVLKEFYPNAANGSDWYIAEGAGHGLNLHYQAPAVYAHILGFLKKNGF